VLIIEVSVILNKVNVLGCLKPENFEAELLAA
jgi:hypothetical protein